MKMGMWNNHGMVEDEEFQRECIEALGMFPEELVLLADHAAREVWVWEQLAKRSKGQVKRKHTLIAGHWRRRARRWKELAAWAEQEFHEMAEEEGL
jgi:hypothetical protein